MSTDDYLWDPKSASVDPFAAELERRLAPLDDVDALLDELDLDAEPEPRPEPGDAIAPHEAGGAVVLSLPSRDSSVEPANERSWPWLAAALLVFGVGVGLLAHVQRQRTAPPAPVVAGAADADARVRIGVSAPAGGRSAHAALVSLREVHQPLASCALELPPGEAVDLRVGVRVGEGRAELADEAFAAAAIDGCVRAALQGWDASALADGELELEIFMRSNEQRDEEQGR